MNDNIQIGKLFRKYDCFADSDRRVDIACMKILYFLLIIIGLYGLTVLLLNVFLGKMVFLPRKLSQDHDYQFDYAFEEIWLETTGLHINALFFPAEDTSKGLILYLHGNADNLQRWGKYTIDFTSIGYDVVAIDYPGYGKSEGSPSESVIYASAEAAWDWAIDRYSPEEIVIYGRSLGCAPASYLGMQHPAKCLMLETPFYSLPDVLESRNFFIPWFNDSFYFPNHEHLAQSKNEVYIFQGTADQVVPYSSAVKLKPLLSDADHFVVIEGGKHKNLTEFELFHEKLAEFLK